MVFGSFILLHDYTNSFNLSVADLSGNGIRRDGAQVQEEKEKFTVVNQHFRATCRATMLPLQVEIVCCPYYHLLAQQIFMLQKVKATSTFCNMKICCARRW